MKVQVASYRSYFLLAGVSFVAACGGASVTGPQTFETEFSSLKAQANTAAALPDTLSASLPSGSAVYLGTFGMTVDLDGTPEAADQVALPGGDFHALGDLRLDVEFAGVSPSLSGTVTNFEAGEGRVFAGDGVLTIASAPLTGSTFTASYSGTLTLDGLPLTVTSGQTTGGAVKGVTGQVIAANHEAVTSYDAGLGAGVETGAFIDGWLFGQLQ